MYHRKTTYSVLKNTAVSAIRSEYKLCLGLKENVLRHTLKIRPIMLSGRGVMSGSIEVSFSLRLGFSIQPASSTQVEGGWHPPLELK